MSTVSVDIFYLLFELTELLQSLLFFSDRKYRSFMLTFEQKDVLKGVIEALEPYEVLTDVLSGENNKLLW